MPEFKPESQPKILNDFDLPEAEILPDEPQEKKLNDFDLPEAIMEDDEVDAVDDFLKKNKSGTAAATPDNAKGQGASGTTDEAHDLA